KQPEVLRTLYMDFKAGIDDCFPSIVEHLTDYEIRELETRDLWFDWTVPPRPSEFGPEPTDDNEDIEDDTPRRSSGKRHSGATPARRDAVTSPRQALEAIKHLTNS
ncbi:chromosome segregation protein ParM, partial [[Kitasatospora] papulosa]